MGSPPHDQPGKSSAGGSAQLEGTEWRLTEHLGPDGNLLPIAEGVMATATIADGRIAGSTGCNRYSGPVTVKETSVAIGQLVTTRMACVPPADAVERAMTAGLEAAATLAVTDEGLELRDADGRAVLRFRAAPASSLTGIEWRAWMINDGRGGVVSAVEGVDVTAQFDERGKVAGSGGCNQYSAAYELDGERLKIGPVTATRMLCTEPERVAEQEAAYFAALERVATWSIREDRLQLRDGEEALQVDYRPPGAEAPSPPGATSR